MVLSAASMNAFARVSRPALDSVVMPDDASASFIPELRDRRPWVMEDMIAAEPRLIESMDRPELARAAGAAAAEVVAAVEAGQAVIVSGCGTSEHGAMAIVAQLRQALRATGRPASSVRARQAFEAWLGEQPGGVHIAVTHEGATAATNAAMARAGQAGARVIAVTAIPNSAAARRADIALITPQHDRSWCHTVGYMSPILAGAAISGQVAGSAPAWARLADAADALLGRSEAAEEIGARLGGLNHLLVVGSGVDATAASELALKVREGARMHTTALPLETVLHGHLAAADRRDGLVAILTEPSARPARLARTRQVLQAARAIGMATCVLTDAQGATELGDATLASAGSLVVPLTGDDATAALVASAIGLQLLTVGLIAARGTNPDRIRREEEAYARAGAVVEREGFPADLR